MRSFGRPVQTVALSPQYKNDRTYISGGKAGNLILTVGGKAGTSAVSTTIGGAMATTNGWLENMGISGSNGVDTVLHRGEGEISTIKWSLNGRYVAWVNEKGIKIMRSNLHLDPGDAELSWKRLTHIDPPDIVGWEDMARLWRARVEWIDEAWLEPDTDFPASANGHRHANSSTPQSATDVKTRERLIVGWGGNIWVIDVHSSARELGKELEERRVGRVELVALYVSRSTPSLRTDRHSLRTDCIISGISLFSSNLLLVLAYVLPGDSTDAASTSTHGTPKKGVHRRQNALQPEVRIIDIFTQEEEYTDTLNMSRYEGLSTTDYHLGVLPPTTSKSPTAAQRGTLEVISGSIWDATMYPKRLFSSATSVQSGTSTTNAGHSGNHAGSTATSGVTDLPSKKPHGPHPALLTSGMKVFIQSPYDCVLATKPTTADHLSWLDVHERYEEAWNLLDTHPEALGNLSENVTSSVASTPTKIKQDSMEEFFASIASQSSTLISKNLNSQVEKEKRRIGEKWMQKLTEAKDWTRAGQISNSVLVTSRSWEHWIWVFAEANQFEAITPFVPTKQLHPPISPTVYEMILGHYIAKDRVRLRDLLESWPPALFSVGSIIAAVEDNLRSEASEEDTDKDDQPRQDWRILKNCLAKLYLANGQVKDALRCFIDLHDADEAMHLISEYHLVDALADDIPGLILLRVSQEQYRNASLNELESASREAIDLLAAEALTGIVRADAVISQLQSKEGMQSFLYFYFRALWKGRASISPTVPKFSSTTDQLASEGRALVNDHADVAINLFAEYDRELFFDFLKSSQSYDLSSASDVCEMRKYIPELVYLLAKEGRTKRALYVIIEMQGDVSAAIFFAKEQDDPDLWNDLLDYSMNKPSFIRALLEEVGTAIDPIMLVRRIPEGLEVQGLRKALSRMLKEYELQHSISEGVARVFRGEVSLGMLQLRNGQKRGIKFDVKAGREGFESSQKVRERISGHCSQCGMAFVEDGESPHHLLVAPQADDLQRSKLSWVTRVATHFISLAASIDSPRMHQTKILMKLITLSKAK